MTDFGLAKLVEGDDLSQSHDLVGTLRFMAPERFRGVTDRRGDIYALGATLYEMLALRPAFAERDQIQLIDQITHQPPAPSAAARPPDPSRPGNDRAQGPGQGPQGPVRDGGRAARRAAAVPGRPADPVAPGRRRRAVLALVQAQPGAGRGQHHGRGADDRSGHRLDHRGLDLSRQRYRSARAGRTEANLAALEKPSRGQGAWSWANRFRPREPPSSAPGSWASGSTASTGSPRRLACSASTPRAAPVCPSCATRPSPPWDSPTCASLWQRDIGAVMSISCDRTLERYAIVELFRQGEASAGRPSFDRMDDDRELFRVPRPDDGFWYAVTDVSARTASTCWSRT